MAAASGSHSNVYATDTQYYDTSNAHIADSSTVGASATDTSPYPANGCTDKATKICLSDAQLQNELVNVMNANGWPTSSGGVQNLFFIFTPKGVGSCAGSSCAYSTYCAYHSWIGTRQRAILYANQPYAAQNYRIYTCDSGQHPNGDRRRDAQRGQPRAQRGDHRRAGLGLVRLPGRRERRQVRLELRDGARQHERCASTTRRSTGTSTTSSRSGATRTRAADSPTSYPAGCRRHREDRSLGIRWVVTGPTPRPATGGDQGQANLSKAGTPSTRPREAAGMEAGPGPRHSATQVARQ